MVSLTKIRDLDLAAATGPGRPLHLSAASGLVCVGDRLYVVADDELHLGAFRTGSAAPGHLIRLFERALPTSTRGSSIITLLGGYAGAMLRHARGSIPEHQDCVLSTMTLRTRSARFLALIFSMTQAR
jgi:hypothetical protein